MNEGIVGVSYVTRFRYGVPRSDVGVPEIREQKQTKDYMIMR